MKTIIFFIIGIFLAVFLYFKKAVNSFKLNLENLSSLAFTKESLQGVVLLHLTNDILPVFSVENVNLEVYLNGVFITPATSTENLNNGYIKIFVDVNYNKIATLDNLLSTLKNENQLTIKGNITGTIGEKKYASYTKAVNEVIKL